MIELITQLRKRRRESRIIIDIQKKIREIDKIEKTKGKSSKLYQQKKDKLRHLLTNLINNGSHSSMWHDTVIDRCARRDIYPYEHALLK